MSMDLAEAKAKNLGATTITLNTLTREDCTSVAFYANVNGVYDPKARINQDWYERRGYGKNQFRIRRNVADGVIC